MARSRGLRVAASKPIATGVAKGPGEDAEAHAAALGAATRSPRFTFEPAISPSLAARKASATITLAPIVNETRELALTHDLVLIETAGGLFTPLGASAEGVVTNATLALALSECDVVLVAPDRIGVLHDLGACRFAANALGLARMHVVLSAPSRSDASTGTNAAEAKALRLVDIACSFPRAEYDAPSSAAAARTLLSRLAI